jgi:hypothetical protein
MKYAIGIGLSAMIYIPSLIKIGSGIPKIMTGINRYRDSTVISQA